MAHPAVNLQYHPRRPGCSLHAACSLTGECSTCLVIRRDIRSSGIDRAGLVCKQPGLTHQSNCHEAECIALPVITAAGAEVARAVWPCHQPGQEHRWQFHQSKMAARSVKNLPTLLSWGLSGRWSCSQPVTVIEDRDGVCCQGRRPARSTRDSPDLPQLGSSQLDGLAAGLVRLIDGRDDTLSESGHSRPAGGGRSAILDLLHTPGKGLPHVALLRPVQLDLSMQLPMSAALTQSAEHCLCLS